MHDCKLHEMSLRRRIRQFGSNRVEFRVFLQFGLIPSHEPSSREVSWIYVDVFCWRNVDKADAVGEAAEGVE